MSTEAVARRYARAIFELGKEKKQLVPLHRELGGYADVYAESPEFRDVVTNPLLSEEGRDQILGDIGRKLKASDLTLRTVRMLGRRRRLATLPDLVRQLGELVDEHEGVLRATVRAAIKLTPAYLQKLKKKAEEATGKKVVLTFEEDPALIAGIVTQIGDRVVDGSVRGKLDRLRESLRQT